MGLVSRGDLDVVVTVECFWWQEDHAGSGSRIALDPGSQDCRVCSILSLDILSLSPGVSKGMGIPSSDF